MYDTPSGAPADPQTLTPTEYRDILQEIEEQPKWRHIADKEMDYADGNQLDGELLRQQQSLGIPPAVEDLIGPSLLSIQGYERITRTDFRVTPNGQPEGQDVADAINFKLNEAERHSRADDAVSGAFRPQIGCGIGWVEVSKDSDPFNYPYRCLAVHRNEIHWDMKAQKADLSDARWLRRQRWLRPERIALVFPKHAELIKNCGQGGSHLEGYLTFLDGGSSTGLNNAWAESRPWTLEEDRWFNPASKELALSELWYRRWDRVVVMRSPNGRVVEYDERNPQHNALVASGRVQVSHAIVSRVRRGYWLGMVPLFDGPTPYPHRFFPYVPFWGFVEDLTGIPYGYVRGMKYAQDSLNSGNSKLRWGMSVARVERTKGATPMSDAQLRRQVARPDADIILDANHMKQPGARFEVKRDFDLTQQQHQLLIDNRATIERVSNITSAFQGKNGTARSGLQEQTQVEQSNQALGVIIDNHRASRMQVGELLMALLIQDMGSAEQVVVIEGDAITPDRPVVLNRPEQDPAGFTYLSNDLQRTRLLVGVEDVPSNTTYRGQQLSALSEAVKALPPQYQAAAMPFLASLMDVPFKRELVEALRAAGQQESPEQIEKRIAEAVQQALANAGNELKARELDLKAAKNEAEIKQIMAQAVQTGVQAAFSAMQAGVQVAQMPMIAPIADAVMASAGYQAPNPGGDDPNFPTADQTAAMNIQSPYIQGEGQESVATPSGAAPEVRRNTSPAFPPVPDDGASPMQGIETLNPDDNLPGEQA